MAYKVTSNRRQNESEANNKASLAIRFMLDAIDKTAESSTPKKHSNLRADKVKVVQGKTGYIAWSKKYALYQEKKAVTFDSKYTTPGTGPHFAENAARRVAKDSDIYFKKAGL